MAKNRVVSIPTFDPKDTLKSIRENSLNPVIRRVHQVETVIESEIEPAIKRGYVDARFDDNTRKIYLERLGKHDVPPLADTVIDLSNIVPAYAGINVKGYKNPEESETDPGTGEVLNTSKVKFHNATISRDPDDEFAKVDFVWDRIVPKYQTKQKAKIDDEEEFSYEKFIIEGDGRDIFTKDRDGNLHLTIPKIPDVQTAIIKGKEGEGPKPFTKILVTGSVGGSIVTPTGELQIDLPDGSSKFNVGYFQGFFASTGDLDAIPADKLYEDRSSAYVKQTIVGVDVYILYMYKGASASPKWVPVVNRAPLIYDAGEGQPNQGIISVKNNPDIVVNENGQLNLDGLRNPDHPGGNYLGLFDNLDEIKKIENPVEDKSYAMVKSHATHNGFLPYVYRKEPLEGGELGWNLTPALGHLMGITGTGTQPTDYKPIYGVKCADASITEKGVLVIPTGGGTKGTVGIIITGAGGGTQTKRGDVKNLRFNRMIADVDYTAGSTYMTMHPAQRIIPDLNQSWQIGHKTEDWLGKVFYDQNTGKWFGMTNKNIAPDEPMWTPVLHKGMSEEVSDLTKRYPQKTPQVVLAEDENDHILWTRNGETWVDADSTALPKIMVEPKCGGFIKTRVKDTVDFPTGIETRVQTFTTDDGTGRTFARSYDKDKSAMGKTVWKPWVRTSYSIDDLKAHEIDPNAHSTHHKWYKTFALEFLWNGIASDGILTQTEVFPILDSYGSSSKDPKSLFVPYTGKFRVIWRMHFEGYRDTPRELPTDGFWKLTLIKGKRGSTATTDIGVWQTTPVAKGSKRFPSMVFTQDDIEMDFHDTISFKVEWTGDDSVLATAAPRLRSIGTRSFVTIEDTNSADGTFNQNALIQLLGRTLSRGNVAIHTHFRGDDESETETVRTYAEKTDPHYAVMTQIPTPPLEGEEDGRV